MDNLPRALMWMRMRPTSFGRGYMSRTILNTLDAQLLKEKKNNFFLLPMFWRKKIHMEIIGKNAEEKVIF